MLSLKRILVAIDFSPISIVALRHGLGIARRYQSNVSLLHVIAPSIYGLAGPDGISADTECAQPDAARIEADLRADGSLEGLKLNENNDFTETGALTCQPLPYQHRPQPRHPNQHRLRKRRPTMGTLPRRVRLGG